MKKVLCPIDFSEASINAIDFAANFCQKANFQLIVINVFTEQEFMKVMDTGDRQGNFNQLKDMAEARLEEISAEIENSFGIKVTHALRLGDLHEIMHKMAERNEYDYLLMGTTGVSNMREAYIGSNTVKAMEQVSKPLICVPLKANFEPLEYMVYATDFAEEDKLIMQELISFAVMFNSRLKVVHVAPHVNDLSRAEFEQFREELASFVSYSKISYHLIEGRNIATTLDAYMDENQADMLVLLHKKRNFLEKMIHQSVSKRMSYLTDYPLLIFKN